MKLKLIAGILGAVILITGLARWGILWRYSAHTSGTITAFFWLDSRSNVLGQTFTDRSAQADVYYSAPGGKSFQISVRHTNNGGPEDIAPNSHIKVLYNPSRPQDAMAEMDLVSARNTDWIICAIGLLIMAMGQMIPWWIKRSAPAKSQRRH